MHLTCVHAAAGLCPACLADYEEDPLAWLEYGDHPSGVRRSAELAAELAAEVAQTPPAARPAAGDDEIPF